MRESQNITLRSAQYHEVSHDHHINRSKASLKSHNTTVMTGVNQEITPVNHFLVNKANSDIASKESGKRNMSDLLQKAEHASILNSKILASFNKMAENVNAQNTKDSEILQQDFDAKVDDIRGFIKHGMNEGVFVGPNATIGASFDQRTSHIDDALYINFLPKTEEGMVLKFMSEVKNMNEKDIKILNKQNKEEELKINADSEVKNKEKIDKAPKEVNAHFQSNQLDDIYEECGHNIDSFIEYLNKHTGRSFYKITLEDNGIFCNSIKIDDIDENKLSIVIDPDNKGIILRGSIVDDANSKLEAIASDEDLIKQQSIKTKYIYDIIDDMEKEMSGAYNTKRQINISFAGDKLSYDLGQLDLSMVYKKYTQNPELLSL